MGVNGQISLPHSGDILRVELDNGLIVLARENFTSPAVVVDGRLPGGSRLDVPGKAGLANFHSRLITHGTQSHSFGDFFELIEGAGASLEVGCGRHALDFGTKSLAEDLPLLLGLLAEVFTEPTFPDKYVEKVRGQLVTQLQMRAHNTRSMAALAFRELAYPEGHPYAISPDGYIETVSAFTRDEVVAFQQTVGPKGGIIVVVGAIKADEAVKLVEEAFGGWQNPAQPAIPDLPPVAPLNEKREKRVSIPGKTQSDITLGFPGPARSAPDFHPARIGNSILGMFGLMGRLGDNVREKQGLAYYSYSHLAGGLGPGPWEVVAGVDPGKVDQAVSSICDEIRRMVEEPVTGEELSDNKSFFNGQLLLGLETNEGVATTLMNMEVHQLGLDYLPGYTDLINAITAEEIQAAARNYLNPDVYALAVAGPE